jgi:hypothetical protein
MLKKIVNALLLKPHGNNLTDGVVETWLLFAMLSVFAVATCDAIAWAYLGFTVASGWLAYAIAIFAGSIALTLVGSLDATFITHDTSDAGAPASSPADDNGRGVFASLKRRVRASHVAIVVRVVLVVLSFTVTAPYLTQTVFNRDIAASIERSNETRVAVKRNELAAKYDKRIVDLSTRLAARNKDLEAEVAGTGNSRRFGDGPTAAAIRSEVAALQNDIKYTEAGRAAELQLFDNASPTERGNRWGVDLEREGPDTRARVVAEMEKSPAFRATRRTVKMFLLFLFLALVSLKLFQPPAVKVYFNAELQAAYKRLRAGIFDAQLDEREHGGAGMAPLHFKRWYEKRQHVREKTEELRDVAAAIEEQQQIREEKINGIRKTLADDIMKMNEDLATANGDNETIEQQLVAARAELTTLGRTLSEQEQELNDFGQLSDDLPLRERRFLIDGRTKATRALAANRVKTNELSATIARLTAELETSRNYCRTITLSLDDASREMVELNTLIAAARHRSIRDLA